MVEFSSFEKDKMKKLTEKDVCMIIATYNRAEDLNRTLSTLIKNKNIPGKIIIVDQSKDDKTKKVVGEYKKKLPVEYIYCKIPSADISMNMGIKKARNKFELILTTADDVDFLVGYIKSALKEFNKHQEVMAIGGTNTLEEYNFTKLSSKLNNLLFKIFFLPFKENHKFRIIGPYGNTSSPKVEKEIKDAEWIPGFNMTTRSEVYKDYLWPEIRGYNVIDDIDSSYSIYRKYGKGSLVITPKCKVFHRFSQAARYAEKKRIFVNHEDHFSYYYRHFKNFGGTIKLIISLVGIILGNAIRLLIKPNKNNFLNLKFNIGAIAYCIKHKEDIKNKRYRTFLNKDLSMKDRL